MSIQYSRSPTEDETEQKGGEVGETVSQIEGLLVTISVCSSDLQLSWIYSTDVYMAVHPLDMDGWPQTNKYSPVGTLKLCATR